jgi:integrase/recombinase XerD
MDETALALKDAIEKYLEWMAANAYSRSTQQNYKCSLRDFLSFTKSRKYRWDNIFSSSSIRCFKKVKGPRTIPAISGLSRYLFNQGKLAQPIQVRKLPPRLPDIYEEFLVYQKNYCQTSDRYITQIRRVLCAFNDYCQQNGIGLKALKIEHVDAFRNVFFKDFSPATRHAYRGYLRKFLSYLYHQRRLFAKDLAPLVLGRREYGLARPPRFLRPGEVQKIFAHLNPSTASEIRTYALMHLAYTMGLRPNEISRIRLDDISFGRQILRLNLRKGDNPLELPIPEHTVKAVAAYIIGARPQSAYRRVFLTLHPPHRPMTAKLVGYHISKIIKQAGLDASAYWMRHTYAQNMLEAGASVFEIKEMLGHDKIESTKSYLRVHIQMMRKVLFDEIL